MKKLYIIGLLVIFSAQAIYAQEYYVKSGTRPVEEYSKGDSISFVKKGYSYLGLNYIYGIPMGDIQSYINNNSSTGVSVDYMYFLNDNISLGGSVGFQYFTQKVENMLSEGDDGFIKGTQFRHLSFVPVLAKANYHFVNSDNFSAFVGVGMGVAFSDMSTEISRYIYRDKSIDFMAKPELGAMYRVYDNFFVNIGLNYNYIMGTEILGNIGYLGTSFGIVIR